MLETASLSSLQFMIKPDAADLKQGDFAPPPIFGNGRTHLGQYYWHQDGRDQRCCQSSYNVQQIIIWPKMSMVMTLRNTELVYSA